MVRTGDGFRVSGGKSSKKGGGTARSSGSKSSSGGGRSGARIGSIVKQPTPEWQKPISSFLIIDKDKSGSTSKADQPEPIEETEKENSTDNC